MTTPSERRDTAQILVRRGISQRKACRYLGLSRRISHYVPRQAGKDQAVAEQLLAASPETGRFRQIRRHLKHAFHHLIGDTSHGDGRHNRHFRMQGVHRMLLHAVRLSFPHPATGERIEAVAPLDAEFRKAFALFGWEENLR